MRLQRRKTDRNARWKPTAAVTPKIRQKTTPHWIIAIRIKKPQPIWIPSADLPSFPTTMALLELRRRLRK